ncbi:MAG: hypothetical protein ACJ74H_16635 [Thermoanaerobaculia bacterium]
MKQLAMLLLLAACRVSADSDARVAQELDRLAALQAKLESGGVPDIVKGALKPNAEAIERARKGTSPEVRLYRLRDAFVYVEAMAFVTEQQGAGKDIDSFIALWKARPVASIATPPDSPLLHAALIEAASNKAEKLYRASLPYGKADGPFSGIYYLGEAHATAAFGRFVASLGVRGAEEPPKAAVLDKAIDGLETDMLKVFDKDPAAPAMIGVSVRLKEARELFDRGSLAGATLLLLEARLSYGRNTAPEAAADVKAPPDLPEDSMAELWRTSDNPLVVRDVLPFYAALRRQS